MNKVRRVCGSTTQRELDAALAVIQTIAGRMCDNWIKHQKTCAQLNVPPENFCPQCYAKRALETLR